MAHNFLCGDRDQPLLLPPDLRDWLPNGHLAWFVPGVVDQLDRDPFLRVDLADGHGHPAYDPKTLLGVLLYAYAIGVRSSRQVERRCVEDVAFWVLAANQAPDHVTIARFRVRRQQALPGSWSSRCGGATAAGMVRLGVVALDGTKVAANAAERANRTLAKLEAEVAEILRQAAAADQREDLQHGQGARGRAARRTGQPPWTPGPAAPGPGPAGGRGGRPPAPLPDPGRRAGRRGAGPW